MHETNSFEGTSKEKMIMYCIPPDICPGQRSKAIANGRSEVICQYICSSRAHDAMKMATSPFGRLGQFGGGIVPFSNAHRYYCFHPVVR